MFCFTFFNVQVVAVPKRGIWTLYTIYFFGVSVKARDYRFGFKKHQGKRNKI